MAENFKKFTGGPTPVLPKGSQEWGGKTTTTKPTTYPHAQDPQQKKRPAQHRDSGTKDPFEPPDTPHRVSTSAGFHSPVSRYGQVRMYPEVGTILKRRTMQAEPVLEHGSQEWSGKTSAGGSPQHHSTVQGSRSGASGGEALRPRMASSEAPRPNVHSTRMMPGAIAPRLKVQMTKKIRGLIGKASNRHRSPYR